tara:strand:- start:986 stop:1291 length:306 start_codon:yes stop_codon:yes gene_type:complete
MTDATLTLILGVVTLAGAGMSTAIVYLFKSIVDLQKESKEQQRELGELKGNQDSIKDLSREVLKVVYSAVKGEAVDIEKVHEDINLSLGRNLFNEMKNKGD